MQPNTPNQVPGQPYNSQQMQPQVPGQPPQSASQLKAAHHGKGTLTALIITIILLLGAIGFGVWAFMERADYRDNVDQKIGVAVDEAVLVSEEAQEKEFIEREKEPFKTYQGPSQFGSVAITYPKTWSAYVDESGNGKAPVDGYMHPSFVPGVDSGISFALRFQVIEEPYDEELDSYSRGVKDGTINVSPVKLEKVPQVAGSRLNGEVERDKQGSVVLFPIRDKTLKVTVLSDQFINDFDNIILKNLEFTP